MREILYFNLLIVLLSCKAQVINAERINGISYVASNEAIVETDVDPIVQLNANYAAIMPFGFIKNLNDPKVYYNSERQWYGETLEGAKQYIHKLQKRGIKIMLKPQIWVWRGEFTGNIEMNNEKDWLTLETSYSKFILDYAQLAENEEVEMLCIGTELEQFIVQRTGYWNKLIQDIRTIYKGQLTYAANWDEFRHTPFWKELDFIGVDAYFPVSFNKTPSVEDCRQGWIKHKETIIEISKNNNNKPVLFTEYGYRSVNFSAKEPWKSDRNMTEVNLEAQANALQALYREFWNEENQWFSGGFLWKWYHSHNESGGHDNSRFTPQNKPAEAVVREAYLKN